VDGPASPNTVCFRRAKNPDPMPKSDTLSLPSTE
jgi:hypothetical protein